MIKIIHGKVIKGNQVGRTIGFPTANIECKSKNIEDGVYKINIIIDDIYFLGAGVYRKNLNIFESYIFNFDENIYGKKIEVVLLEKIRENKKIDNLEELKLLINNDIKKIKSIKSNVLTFGTFDYVHKGHEYFLKQSKKYGNKLITVIATDKNVERFKGKPPVYNIYERIEHIKNLYIADEIVGGNENSPLKCIEKYKPKVICLGYDQKGFSSLLNEHIKENNLNIEIIRLKPYKENVFKSSIIKNQSK